MFGDVWCLILLLLHLELFSLAKNRLNNWQYVSIKSKLIIYINLLFIEPLNKSIITPTIMPLDWILWILLQYAYQVVSLHF